MRRPITLLVAGILLVGCGEAGTMGSGPEPVAHATARTNLPPAGAGGVTVLTRNIYLGADLGPLLDPTNPFPVPVRVAQTWAQVLATSFPERAGALAAEIQATQPHLIGLQEVVLYRLQQPGDAAFGGMTRATDVAFDFLQILQDSLAGRGMAYYVASSQQQTDLEFPALVSQNPLSFMDIRYTDRDVILARSDVTVADPRGANFAQPLPANVGGVSVAILRGWTSVKATVAGNTFRFVNTHLETQQAPPVQHAQTAELLGILEMEPLPVILVGDFNSAADRSQTATYGMIASAGFVDAWTERQPTEPGFTCCHPASLRGFSRAPTTRIDLVFARDAFGIEDAGIVGGVHADVLGEEPEDRTRSGLWPSDHAGVAVTLRLPGAVAARR